MMMRRLALVLAVLTLGIGPWLGLPAGTLSVSPTASFAQASEGSPALGQVAQQTAPQPARRLSQATGCGCREVVVEASNVVRDAEVRTGDAEVVNKTITYIAPSYEDTDVDVDQEAEAFSGDAVAGQILTVDGGDGCSRVHVSAKNIVEDAEVRSGDAFARNESVILIDPSIKREDLEIEVEQEAVAESGDAVAGQIIDVKGGGPCGGVILEALNRVHNVELRTGEATTENLSEILTCEDEGCIDDLERLLADVDAVEVCNADGCDTVPVEEFVDLMKEQAEAPDDPDSDDESQRTDDPSHDDVSADDGGVHVGEVYRTYHPRDPNHPRSPKTPSPSPVPTATPEPTPL
jgi:hypothetical protein